MKYLGTTYLFSTLVKERQKKKLKFLLFYPVNKEIQRGKIQNNIYFQDKRAGISKFLLSFSTLFLHISCDRQNEDVVIAFDETIPNTPQKNLMVDPQRPLIDI